MDHGCQELNISKTSKVTGFVQVVEALVFHNLTDNFIGYLAKQVESITTYLRDKNGIGKWVGW